MILQPEYSLQTTRLDAAIGHPIRPSATVTDLFQTLLAGALQEQKSGVWYERNTGNLMCEPVPLWRDLLASDVTTGGPVPSNKGHWEQITDRALGVQAMSQYDATPDAEYDLITNSATFLPAGASFAVKLQMGPPPATSPDTTHDRDNYYRAITWPQDAKAGETMYQVEIRYGETPFLSVSKSKDRFGDPIWTRSNIVPCTADLGSLWQGNNVEIVVSFIQIDGGLLCWIGSGFNHDTMFHKGEKLTRAGRLQVSGKNGYTTVAFGDIVYKTDAYFDSYELPAPLGFKTQIPRVYINPSPGGPGSGGTNVVFRILQRDVANGLFRYQLHLHGPPIDATPQFSRSTPLVKQITIEWPQIWGPPHRSGWQEVDGVRRITEHQTFDIGSGWVRTSFEIELDNSYGQRRAQDGIEAARVSMGWRHSGVWLRGSGLANTRGNFQEDGSLGSYNFFVDDLSNIIDQGVLRSDINPTGWCVYALIRYLMAQAGIVPELLGDPASARGIPNDPPGPNPPCNHTKMPFHPIWRVMTPITACINDVREVEQAWCGTSTVGNFFFTPFDFAPRRLPKKIFREVANVEGGDFGQIFSQINSPIAPPGGSGVNEIHHGLIRGRSLDEVRNDIVLIGWEETTGKIFAEHAENAATIASRLIPNNVFGNYKGFSSPLIHNWSGYATRAFARYVGDKLKARVPLVHETIRMPCYGQPTLFCGDIIEVQSRRTIGLGARYWVTGLHSTWDITSPDRYVTTVEGFWIGLPPIPGRS